MAENQFGNPGGTIGSVYTGQQGVDRAVVLGEADDALAAFTGLINDQQKIQAEQKKAQEEAKKEAEKKKPEAGSWWIQHDAEMTGKANELMTFGGKLMAAGVDPLNGTTPEALKYRTELDLFNQDAKMSQQVKDMYIKEKAVIDGDKEGKFTQESKDNLLAWFSQNSLKDIKEKGLLPPNLEIAKPEFNRTKFYGEFVKDINIQNPDPNDADLYSFIGQTMNDPAQKEYVMTLQADAKNIEKYTPEYYKVLQQEAKDLGVSVEQYIGKQQLQTYFKKEPFAIETAMNKYLPKAHTEARRDKDQSGTETWSEVTNVSDEKLTESAKTFLTMNPDALPYLVESTKNLEEKDRVVNLETATKWVKTYMKNQIETKKETGTTYDKEGVNGTGKTQAQLNKDHDQWRLALVGKRGKNAAQQKRAQQNAFDFIIGSKTAENYPVVDVYQPDETKFSLLQMLGVDAKFLNPQQKAELGKGRKDLIVLKVKVPSKKSTTAEDAQGQSTTTTDVEKFKFIVYDLSANPKVDEANDIKSFSASASNPFYEEAVRLQKKLWTETYGEDVSYETPPPDIKSNKKKTGTTDADKI